MVRFALESIAAQNYENVDVAVIDDGSTVPIKPILDDLTYPVRLFNTYDSVEKKRLQGGSRHGFMINRAIRSSDADLAIMLCDDDALAPGYLSQLDQYYTDNLYIQYSYGHVAIYNPYESKDYASISASSEHILNENIVPIDPYCQVDASQVSWRLDSYNIAGIQFPYPMTTALDAAVYRQMYTAFGPCVFNGIITQYKGVYPDQMGRRIDPYSLRDKESYGG
jgi:glycosyltransferase involved in cell wall biosynthesis